jgi:hypothetical protein
MVSLFDCVSRECLQPCAFSDRTFLNGYRDKELKLDPAYSFASSNADGKHAAAISSLIGTAKLNGIDPQTLSVMSFLILQLKTLVSGMRELNMAGPQRQLRSRRNSYPR